MTNRIQHFDVLFLCLLLMAGCSNSGPQFVPADGIVTLNGGPLSDATVTFVPDKGPVAMGITDSQGKFKLSTGSFRGIVTGNAKVAITLNAVSDSEKVDLATQFSKRPGSDADAQDYLNRASKVQQEMQAAKRAANPKGSAHKSVAAKEKPNASLIPQKYSRADTSGLSYPIKPDGDNHFKIEL